jgi:hypothetical protein
MNEEVPCPDPNEPVTRRILQEELARYATKEDLQEVRDDLSRQMRALAEETWSKVIGLFDQVLARLDELRDLPERTTRLEASFQNLERRTQALEAARRVRKRAARSRKKRT